MHRLSVGRLLRRERRWEDISIIVWEVDEADTKLCPVVGFCTSIVGPLCSISNVIVGGVWTIIQAGRNGIQDFWWGNILEDRYRIMLKWIRDKGIAVISTEMTQDWSSGQALGLAVKVLLGLR
jgi:hypothetical protein